MYDSADECIYWLLPKVRAVLPLNAFHCSRSLAKVLRRGIFEIRVDTCFTEVMRACADREEGTWISEDFITVYTQLHEKGLAHSLEAWHGDKLAGGVYGVAMGGAFLAESMFHYETNASKAALAALVDRLRMHGFALMDVQFLTPHLASLGAVEISHRQYFRLLQNALAMHCEF